MGAVDKSRSMAAGSGCHGRMLTPGADDVIAADVSSELERLLDDFPGIVDHPRVAGRCL